MLIFIYSCSRIGAQVHFHVLSQGPFICEPTGKLTATNPNLSQWRNLETWKGPGSPVFDSFYLVTYVESKRPKRIPLCIFCRYVRHVTTKVVRLIWTLEISEIYGPFEGEMEIGRLRLFPSPQSNIVVKMLH